MAACARPRAASPAEMRGIGARSWGFSAPERAPDSEKPQAESSFQRRELACDVCDDIARRRKLSRYLKGELWRQPLPRGGDRQGEPGKSQLRDVLADEHAGLGFRARVAILLRDAVESHAWKAGRKLQSDQEPARRGTHGRQIGEIDGQRLVANLRGAGSEGQSECAFTHGIDGHGMRERPFRGSTSAASSPGPSFSPFE